jgi:hypothetical protein
MLRIASAAHHQTLFACLAVAALPAWCGCGAASAEAPEHEAHDHEAALPSFAEATDSLGKLHAELDACWAAAMPDDGIEHLLHEIEELLDALPEAAVDSDLPKAEWFQLRDAVRAWRQTLENLESALQSDWQATQAAGKRYSVEAATAIADLQRYVGMAYPADETAASDTPKSPSAMSDARTPKNTDDGAAK